MKEMNRDDTRISPFFKIFQKEEWWPYVMDLVVPDNIHGLETCMMVAYVDFEFANLLERRWQLAMHCFCGWLVRQAECSIRPTINCEIDAVRLMHNYLMPGTQTGDGVKETLRWAEQTLSAPQGGTSPMRGRINSSR